jgi:aminoglycoside phosphotransferase (APT) family kinase protein
VLTVDKSEPVDFTGDPRFQRLSDYLALHVPDLEGPLGYSRFPGGFSNQTYLVTANDRELVLKAAPPGNKAKGAHDVGREYDVAAKLAPFYPYLAKAILRCDDPAVFGEPFYVMERVRGIVVRSYPDDVPPDLPGKQFARLIEAMAALHAVDYEKAGLSALGKPQGYRARQLKGWRDRLEAARTDDMADFSAVDRYLAENPPGGEERASIIHNDFKLDNVMWDPQHLSQLLAVLDWEMATLGDPYMDLACTLSFWVEIKDPLSFRSLRAMPTARAGVMTRREALARYADRSGRAAPDFKPYFCYALLRRAAIEQQKYFRYKTGQSTDPRFVNLDAVVRVLRDTCLGVIGGAISI